jgi:flagellin-like hook-associated protein FlgL
VNTEPIAAFLAPYERFTEEQSMNREEKLGELFIDIEFAAKQKLVLAHEETEKAKQKEAVNKEIEQRIQTLVELGMTVDEAGLQVAQNMEEAEGAAGAAGPSAAGAGSRKQAKGKGKKWTRKSRRI